MIGSRFTFAIPLVVLLVTAGIATAQQSTGTRGPLSEADGAFVRKVAAASDHEVKLGELAQEKAQSTAVKDFGARIARDHKQAGQELKGLAQKRDVTLESRPPAKDASQTASLSKLSGQAFDKQFVSAMVKDHEKDVAEFQRMSRQAQDPELKAWVVKVLPTLEEHLQLAKGIQGSRRELNGESDVTLTCRVASLPPEHFRPSFAGTAPGTAR